MKNLMYFSQMCFESAAQVRQMLTSVQSNSGYNSIVLVNEGTFTAHVNAIREMMDEEFPGVDYYESPQLKYPQSNGAMWFQRMYWLCKAHNPDWIIKLDPDSVMRKPLSIFPDVDAFGHIHHAGTDAEHIQGGCHVLRMKSLDKLLPFTNDARFMDTDNYVPVNFRLGFKQTGEVSMDFSFMELARMSGGFEIGRSREIESYQCDTEGFNESSRIIHPVRIKVDNT